MSTIENNYYNAKPSNIKNLGIDIRGAKRMNFDTYETTEEREKKKRINKTEKGFKDALKNAILADVPNAELIANLISDKFESDHGFRVLDDNARAIIMAKRELIKGDSAHRIAFNKLVSNYNTANRTLSDIKRVYGFARYIAKMKKRYEPKDSFIDETGAKFDWKDFEASSTINESIEFTKNNSTAVQFGNSVSDKERGYILGQLASFIKHWQSCEKTSKVNLNPVSWSFGARGNAQSVAYFQYSGNVLSVNRNNIGSIIHELGHFLDHQNNTISSRISRAVIEKYSVSLPDDLSRKQMRYYCSRVEIFARAFEAYSYKHQLGFSQFAQCGNGYLPELCDELNTLVEQALGL